MKHGNPIEPYGHLYAEIFKGLEYKTDDELSLLRTAALGCTSTNCWWATYRVAQLLIPEIDGIFYRRQRAAKEAASQ